MARVTVEDCLKNVKNRFELVMIASKRARQIATGGKEPLVREDGDKPTVLALREIEENLINAEILQEAEQAEQALREELQHDTGPRMDFVSDLSDIGAVPEASALAEDRDTPEISEDDAGNGAEQPPPAPAL